jgi:hypothetical protein
VLSLVTHPESPETMYAGTAAAIYGSSDGGRTWHTLKNDLYVTALAIDPRSPSTLYAATHLGVLKSESSGTQWKPLRMAPMLSDPTEPGTSPRRTGGAPKASSSASPLPALPVRPLTAKAPPPLPVHPSPLPSMAGGSP